MELEEKNASLMEANGQLEGKQSLLKEHTESVEASLEVIVFVHIHPIHNACNCDAAILTYSILTIFDQNEMLVKEGNMGIE